MRAAQFHLYEVRLQAKWIDDYKSYHSGYLCSIWLGGYEAPLGMLQMFQVLHWVMDYTGVYIGKKIIERSLGGSAG